jgi:hypothetical protein
LNENPLNGGCGSIIRDSAGYVAGPGAGQMKFSHDAIHTEAIARIQAVTAAKNRGMEYEIPMHTTLPCTISVRRCNPAVHVDALMAAKGDALASYRHRTRIIVRLPAGVCGHRFRLSVLINLTQ